MRLHRWRYGILFLAVFLALPVMAEDEALLCGGDEEKPYNSTTQTCLQWFSPTDGTRQSVVFNHPKDCDADLECVLVDGETELSLEKCDFLNISSEVTLENGMFFVTGFPQAEVYCFEDDTQKKRIFDLPTGENFCSLANSSYVDIRWSDVFLPYEENKKAEPWNSTASYCPDPINHSEAYDLDPSVKTGATADIVRRTVLEGCATVVQKYKKACEEKSGGIYLEIQKKEQEKSKDLQDKKRELIQTWIPSSTNCDKTKPFSGTCLTEWNAIKGLMADDCKIDGDGEFVIKGGKVSKLNSTFQDKIKGKMSNSNWESRTLDQFLTSQAESLLEPKIINDAITAKTVEQQKMGQTLSFLQKRGMNIALSNSLSATKNFNVTNLLRRNTGSIESQLTLLGEEKFDKNGNSLNIFNKIIRLVAQVLGSLGVLLLIVSAVMMVVSQGEETMLQKAKQTFLYTIIGLVIAFFSYTIVRFLLELLLLR
jgi:hypothetical protein